MDSSPQSASQVVQCVCPHCRRRWWWPFEALFRLVGSLIILAAVFIAGLAVGSSPDSLPFTRGGYPRADNVVMPRMMARVGTGDLRLKLDSDDRQFGVITAVTGQLITIADNGGGTKSVLITSDTNVFDGEREIPMWKLQRGNSVRVYGNVRDGVTVAKLIEIIK